MGRSGIVASCIVHPALMCLLMYWGPTMRTTVASLLLCDGPSTLRLRAPPLVTPSVMHSEWSSGRWVCANESMLATVLAQLLRAMQDAEAAAAGGFEGHAPLLRGCRYGVLDAIWRLPGGCS